MAGTELRMRCLAGCLSGLLAPVLAAQDLSLALKGCRAEQDDAKRLACYDRQLDAQLQSPSDAAKSDATLSGTAAAAEERFGVEGELARSDRERARKEGRELHEMHSTIARLDSRPDGVPVITLKNGQVWVPKEFDPNVNLRVGDPIRIRRGALDSYVLNGRSKWSTRVKRLR